MRVGVGALAVSAGVALGGAVLASSRSGSVGASRPLVDRGRAALRGAGRAVRSRWGAVAGATRTEDAGAVTAESTPEMAGARGFVPALEGLRAAAAIGVLTTHVAFVTGSSTGSVVNRIWGRLDLSVGVFFALSGFLLWRTQAIRARTEDPPPQRRTGEYLRSRLVRIMPAYAMLVVGAMVLLPENHVNGPWVWLTNLTFTQIYQPRFLVTGLTHAWSLSVEMAFYLAMPLLWTAMGGLRGRLTGWRIPSLLAFAGAGLAFPLVPWTALGVFTSGVNDQILPPAFAAWFAAGMVLAEVAVAPPGRLAALCRAPLARWGWWAAAAATYLATTSTRWFSEGFVHPSGIEFSTRTALSALMSFLVLAPVALAPRGIRFPVLESEPAQALGRWSYGIFLWHLLVLNLGMQAVGVPLWSGRMNLVWPVTVVGSVAVAAASFAFVEQPSRAALENWAKTGKLRK